MDYFEIGDISDECAVNHLIDKGLSEEVANVAVNKLAGGRYRLLNELVEELGGNVKDREKCLQVIDGE